MTGNNKRIKRLFDPIVKHKEKMEGGTIDPNKRRDEAVIAYWYFCAEVLSIYTAVAKEQWDSNEQDIRAASEAMKNSAGEKKNATNQELDEAWSQNNMGNLLNRFSEVLREGQEEEGAGEPVDCSEIVGYSKPVDYYNAFQWFFLRYTDMVKLIQSEFSRYSDPNKVVKLTSSSDDAVFQKVSGIVTAVVGGVSCIVDCCEKVENSTWLNESMEGFRDYGYSAFVELFLTQTPQSSSTSHLIPHALPADFHCRVIRAAKGAVASAAKGAEASALNQSVTARNEAKIAGLQQAPKVSIKASVASSQQQARCCFGWGGLIPVLVVGAIAGLTLADATEGRWLEHSLFGYIDNVKTRESVYDIAVLVVVEAVLTCVYALLRAAIRRKKQQRFGERGGLYSPLSQTESEEAKAPQSSSLGKCCCKV